MSSVNKMVAKLFPDSIENSNNPWSAKDVKRLKELLGSAGNLSEWARIFKRTEQEIERKIESFRAEISERPWSREALVDLKRLYGSRSNYDMSLILGMPEAQIEAKALELCLAKDKKFVSGSVDNVPTKMPRWTEEDVETLKRMHGTASNSQIAKLLGRTTKSITSKANSFGLKKTSDHLRKMGKDNVQWRYNCEKREEEENDAAGNSDA